MDTPAPPPKPKPVRKPPRPGLVGPLFSWELLRLARRGQDARGRFILAVSLFVILTAFSLIWFRHGDAADLFFGGTQTLSIHESSAFGSSFSLTFVYGQLAVLCLLAPAYAAGGIAEEKDKRTLVYLLVSDLTDREIVFGKFFGRTAFLLGVMLAGLPILAITQLHGGVSLKFLLFCYLLTASTVVLLSAVAAVAAAGAETYRGGLFRAYGFTALIVIAGCGLGPYVSPFAVVFYLYGAEVDEPGLFWGMGFGYPAAQLGFAAFAVWLAVRAVGRMRARLVRATPKPPPWVRERYRDEDRETARRERLRQEREAELARRREWDRLRAEAGPPLELVPDDPPPGPPPPPPADGGGPKRLKARRVLVARPLPAANSHARPPADPAAAVRGRTARPTGYRDPELHAARHWKWRPRVADADPFYWKERYTAGAVQTEDDESMRSMMYLVGGVLGLVVVFFLLIAGVALAGGQESNRGFARGLLLVAGGAGVFAHLLQIGMAAAGSVCRERQRLTLESLLTIPVPRRAVLWPKWLVSLSRGWWWGGPAAGVLVIAFLTTDAPVAALPALAYVAAVAPCAASYGVWLSIRCPTVNRAVMWFLPAAGLLAVAPVAVCGWIAPASWAAWCGLLLGLAAAAAASTWLFWRASARAFEVETVLGRGRG